MPFHRCADCGLANISTSYCPDCGGSELVATSPDEPVLTRPVAEIGRLRTEWENRGPAAEEFEVFSGEEDIGFRKADFVRSSEVKTEAGQPELAMPLSGAFAREEKRGAAVSAERLSKSDAPPSAATTRVPLISRNREEASTDSLQERWREMSSRASQPTTTGGVVLAAWFGFLRILVVLVLMLVLAAVLGLLPSAVELVAGAGSADDWAQSPDSGASIEPRQSTNVVPPTRTPSVELQKSKSPTSGSVATSEHDEADKRDDCKKLCDKSQELQKSGDFEQAVTVARLAVDAAALTTEDWRFFAELRLVDSLLSLDLSQEDGRSGHKRVNVSEALEIVGRLLEKRPRSGGLWYRHGVCCYRLDRKQEAFTSFFQARELSTFEERARLDIERWISRTRAN
jgi:hypothetical protein